MRRGDRVFIRPPETRDSEEFLARVPASRKLHRPWVQAPDAPEKFKALVARSKQSDFESLLVCERESGSIAGVINFSQIFLGNFRSAYTGYYALVPFEGQGLLSEGLRLALRHAFLGIGLHRVEANIQPGNAASISLVQRCGFKMEGFSPRYLKIGGRWRDHERWALTVEDWRSEHKDKRDAPRHKDTKTPR